MKEETIKKRKNEIFQAALKLFAEKGYDKTTLDEIAAEINISKPALYLYFKNKEELFFSLIETKLNEFKEGIVKKIESNDDTLSKFKFIVSTYIKFFQDNINFFKIIHNVKMRLNNMGMGKFQERFKTNYQAFIDKIAKLMEEGIQKGILRKDDKYFYAFSLLGLINQNIFRVVIYNLGKEALKDIDKKVLEIFFKGAGK